MLPSGWGDFPEHRNRALELARCHLLEVDLVLLEKPMQVRDRRDDADRADNGEGRGDDAVGGRGHHVTAARRHLVDRRCYPDLAFTQSEDLGSGETVAGHRAAAALDPYDRFVGLRPRDREQRVDLLAELPHRRRAHVTLERHYIDALAGRLGHAPRLGGGFRRLLARLDERLALLLVEERSIHCVAQVVVALVQRTDLDLPVLRLGRSGEPRDNDGEFRRSQR